ncbi:hypothetical protein [Helicobacter sp. 23-1045]
MQGIFIILQFRFCEIRRILYFAESALNFGIRFCDSQNLKWIACFCFAQTASQ